MVDGAPFTDTCTVKPLPTAEEAALALGAAGRSEFVKAAICALPLSSIELSPPQFGGTGVRSIHVSLRPRHWGQVDTCQTTSVDFRISLDDKYRPDPDDS